MIDVHYRDLRDMLENTEKLYRDEVAYKLKFRSEIVGIKYSKFIDDIKALGAYLLDLNMKNNRVIVISKNRYEWCVSYLATVTSDLIVVPLDKSLPEEEFYSLVERAEADVIIYDNIYEDRIKKLKENEKTTLKYYINMDTDLNKCIEEGKVSYSKNNCKYKKVKIDNEKMRFMLFTSGTTSASKCVMLSHKNICADIEQISATLDVNKDDTLLSFLPLHHTFECTAGFLYAISVGAKIAFCDGIRHMVDNMKEYEVSAMISVPALYESIYKRVWKQIEQGKREKQVKVALKASEALLKVGVDMRKQLFKQIHETFGGHVRFLVSGAAGIDPKVAKGFNDFGIIMYQGYGLTETSPVVSVENMEFSRNGSVGKPMKKNEVKIDEPDADGIGEILVKGPNVMLGYYKNDEETKKVLSHGWFKTGDLGRVDEDGFLYITGRKKDVIVLKNGKNIFPEELEALVNRIDCVKESMVYGGKDKDGDVEVRVKIVYDKDAVLDKLGVIQDEELEDYFWENIKKVNKEMPTYKYIKGMILTDEPLIKTTTNKVKRFEELKKINEGK